jgi:hypothetical protein
MKIPEPLLSWLLEGDPSIAFQAKRDLLGVSGKGLDKAQSEIARRRWGKAFLEKQGENGHWGRGLYQPKWICTHYTKLDLKTLGIEAGTAGCVRGTQQLLESTPGCNGGINYARTIAYSDVCINGMLLNIAGYFHSTVCVLEGLAEYQKTKNTRRQQEVKTAIAQGAEFLLAHRLYRSHRTNAIVDPRMLRLSFPCRWHYDILRGLEVFWSLGLPYDKRMSDAIEQVLKKRRPDGTWPLQAKHPGETHFEMEKVGAPSRWNTLRALRTLKYLGAL